MFKVRNADHNRIFTVYAVSGTYFLIWNDTAEDAHWGWVDMNKCKPVQIGG